MIINANAYNPAKTDMEYVWGGRYINSEFNSGKVALDLRGCSFVCIVFITSTTDLELYTEIVPVDLSSEYGSYVSYYKNKQVYFRAFSIEPDGITFSGGAYTNISAGTTTTRIGTHMVPYQIYTIR